jgi:pimeloyl-ACP methyl ester carboxylesterase
MLVTAPPVEARLERLAPPGEVKQSHRAVVLFHGLRVQPVSAAAVRRAEPSFWESEQAPLVKLLSQGSDVFGFHYAQTTTVDDVAKSPELFRSMQRLRETGYVEIVLIGYSAGAIVARQFVEDNPESGVTKVIQVGAPNGGSDWTVLMHGVRAPQVKFVESLTKDARRIANQVRADRRIPDHVQFVCVVTVSNWIGDGVVRRDAQWTNDLQTQNIPAEVIFLPHVGAMFSSRLSAKVRDLVVQPQHRWTPDQVQMARPRILGLTTVLGRSQVTSDPPFGMHRP